MESYLNSLLKRVKGQLFERGAEHMLDNQIRRGYVRTDTWSVNAIVSGDKNDGAGKRVGARVQDIAAGGLLFLTDEPFEVGEELWLELDIDPMIPGIYGRIHMEAKGEIRGDRGIRDGRYAYSVEFTEITNENRTRLDELIRLTNFRYRAEADFELR